MYKKNAFCWGTDDYDGWTSNEYLHRGRGPQWHTLLPLRQRSETVVGREETGIRYDKEVFTRE